MMVQSVIYQAFCSIFTLFSQIYEPIMATSCKKDRKMRLKNAKHHPIVRLYRIICSAAGHKFIGIPKNLTENELALKHILDNCSSAQLELHKFHRLVLRPSRDIEQFESRCCRLKNDENQHPDTYPYPTEADDILQELQFRESDEYFEMGKTYFWYIHRYDEKPSFAKSTTFGNCQFCNRGLQVCRNCLSCAFAYYVYKCDDIYVRCLECNMKQHPLDLVAVTKCNNCGGPPNIEIFTSQQDDEDNWE